MLRGILLTFLFLTNLSAGEWPQWRGPQRDAVASSVALPDRWPERLSLSWQIEVGEGHSSPVISDSQVFIHTRSGEKEVVSCLRLSDGTLLWRTPGQDSPYEMNSAARSHGKGPKSTPAIAGDRLFTLGITGVLTAWSVSTGERLWQKDFRSEFPSQAPLYGTATSPLVHGGRVVAFVGEHDKGALRAFDEETGKTLWSWEGDGPGYVSPIVFRAGGIDQIVTQSQKKIIGVAFLDGRLLWEIPFETPWAQNIVTPLVHDDLLVFSGLDNGIFAIRMEQDAGRWQHKTIWRNPDLSMYMSSPVMLEGLLFGLARERRGHFFCLTASDGKVVGGTEGRDGEHASIVLAGQVLLALTENAQLKIFRATRDFELLAEYTVAESPTWAHLAVSGDRLLVKDQTKLLCWKWSQEP